MKCDVGRSSGRSRQPSHGQPTLGGPTYLPIRIELDNAAESTKIMKCETAVETTVTDEQQVRREPRARRTSYSELISTTSLVVLPRAAARYLPSEVKSKYQICSVLKSVICCGELPSTGKRQRLVTPRFVSM